MRAIDVPRQIDEMMAEIESSMAAKGVDFEDDTHHAYIVAKLHLNSEDPDQRYIHNMLANALNKPLMTRH